VGNQGGFLPGVQISKMKRSAKGVKAEVKESLKEYTETNDIELELITTLRAKPYIKTNPAMQFHYEVLSPTSACFPALHTVLAASSSVLRQKLLL